MHLPFDLIRYFTWHQQ